jgi:hypothetical protein
MSLQIAEHPNPLPILEKELASVNGVCEELEDNISKLITQLHGLCAVRNAISNEIKRLGPNAEQLEFEIIE